MGSCCSSRNQINNIFVNNLLKNQNFQSDYNTWKTLYQKRSSISQSSYNKSSSVFILNNEDIHIKYQFGNIIDKGFFGTVRIVNPIEFPELKFACKSINKSKFSENKLILLIREIETLSMVDHPNIVKYIETYSDNHYLHIIMELFTGGNLLQKIEKMKKFTEKYTRKFIFKLSSAISHCHSQGIVHRDLKPENILFENKKTDSELKLIDFGLSRKYYSNEDLHSIVGSPYYVAPEVLNGNYNEKCDVWSIGVLTYTMLCGYPPFNGSKKEEIFQKIKYQNVSFEGKKWVNISEDAKNFIKSLMQKKSIDRPSSKEIFSFNWLNPSQNETQITINNHIFNIENQFQGFKKLTKIVIDCFIMLIPEKEKKELNEAFNILDIEKTGVLTMKEIEYGIEKFNLNCNIENFEKIAQKKYSNDSQKKEKSVSYTNFLEFLMNKKKLINKENLRKVFHILDFEHKNNLDSKSFIKYYERMGKKKSQDKINEIFTQIGLKKDDKINFQIFYESIIGNLNLN